MSGYCLVAHILPFCIFLLKNQDFFEFFTEIFAHIGFFAYLCSKKLTEKTFYFQIEKSKNACNILITNKL